MRSSYLVLGPPFISSKARAMATATSPDLQRLDPSVLIEEEIVPGYKAEDYYPVHVGEIFKQRYKTIGKLGYGSASTVWLCRDLDKQNEFKALKLYINRSKVHRELPIYEHINSLRSEHEGRNHVRKLIEAFEVQGPHGRHICLVHEPMGMSLNEVRAERPNGVLSAAAIRELFRYIVRGL